MFSGVETRQHQSFTLAMQAELFNHLLSMQATAMNRVSRLIETAETRGLERANFTLSLYADEERTQLIGEEKFHAKPLLYDITPEACDDLLSFLWNATFNTENGQIIILKRAEEEKEVKDALLYAELCIRQGEE